MWDKSQDNRMASTNDLENTIYVGGMSALRYVQSNQMLFVKNSQKVKIVQKCFKISKMTKLCLKFVKK